MIEITRINELLSKITIPYLQQDLISSKAVKNIEFNASEINIAIQLEFPANSIREKLIQEVTQTLNTEFPEHKINCDISWAVATKATQAGLSGIPNVKNIIAVASGKGGVGKSTTAANLALALMLEGARVGMLDADIYGPNQPQMLGVTQQPETTENKKLKPIMAHGIQTMSIGFLIAQEDTPMIWRGPMVSSALQQLLNDTEWDNLDYLIIDLPPGTGDIQLTLAQKIPVSGAAVITTPQDIALLDVKKAIKMFEKVKIPVLGIIENMSVHICKNCGTEEFIFGTGGADKMAEQYNLTILGHLPLDMAIRLAVDQGKPTVIAEPDGMIAKKYRAIALQLAANLATQTKKYSFPKIVIEKE